jgi:hypothetical protein
LLPTVAAGVRPAPFGEDVHERLVVVLLDEGRSQVGLGGGGAGGAGGQDPARHRREVGV